MVNIFHPSTRGYNTKPIFDDYEFHADSLSIKKRNCHPPRSCHPPPYFLLFKHRAELKHGSNTEVHVVQIQQKRKREREREREREWPAVRGYFVDWFYRVGNRVYARTRDIAASVRAYMHAGPSDVRPGPAVAFPFPACATYPRTYSDAWDVQTAARECAYKFVKYWPAVSVAFVGWPAGKPAKMERGRVPPVPSPRAVCPRWRRALFPRPLPSPTLTPGLVHRSAPLRSAQPCAAGRAIDFPFPFLPNERNATLFLAPRCVAALMRPDCYGARRGKGSGVCVCMYVYIYIYIYMSLLSRVSSRVMPLSAWRRRRVACLINR